MDDDWIDRKSLEKKLSGTTLKVYYVLLKERNQLSLRDIQRKARLSSASLALHHLDKLKDLDLVKMNPHGGYYVSKEVRVGILRFFIGRRGLILPRYLVYFVFFLSEIVGFLLIFGLRLDPSNIVLLITLLIACCITFYETLVMWKSQPLYD